MARLGQVRLGIGYGGDVELFFNDAVGIARPVDAPARSAGRFATAARRVGYRSALREQSIGCRMGKSASALMHGANPIP